MDFMGLSDIHNQAPQTLKLNGELQGIPIQILVDSGASHNFISRKLASKLALPIQSFYGLLNRLGDGHRVWVKERCNQVAIKLGDVSCVLNAVAFDLGNLDMVFGIDWLNTLGDVIHN